MGAGYSRACVHAEQLMMVNLGNQYKITAAIRRWPLRSMNRYPQNVDDLQDCAPQTRLNECPLS